MIDGSRSLEITMLVAGIDFVLGQWAAGICQYASDTTIVELQLFGDESYPIVGCVLSRDDVSVKH